MNGKRSAQRKKDLAEENKLLGEIIRQEIREMVEIEKENLSLKALKSAKPSITTRSLLSLILQTGAGKGNRTLV